MKNKWWVYINGYRVVETKSIGYKWVRYGTSENSLFKRIKRSEWDKACIRPLEEQQHRLHIRNLADDLNISNVKKSRKKFFFRDPVPLRKRYLKDRYVLLCTTRTCSGMWKSRLEYGDNHIEKNFCFSIIWFGLIMFWFRLVDFTSFGVCTLSRYVTMQNLELVASKMSELCQF